MKINIPTNCPSCNSILERVDSQLFCRNNLCEAKSSKKLMHYTKTMKIMGLGEKTLEKLEASTISDLYSLDQFTLIEKLGEKIGTKIHSEIEKSKNTTLSKFLSAMSIPLIGKVAAEKVQKVVSSIEDINEEVCKKAGLGPKATQNLMDWKSNQYDSMIPISFSDIDTEGCFTRNVCFSGKTPGYTKAQLKELLMDYNVNVVDNVTKSIDFLVTEEETSTKIEKAKQYNINIITFNELINMLENE
jgi:DNA ligase (NAD+)